MKDNDRFWPYFLFGLVLLLSILLPPCFSALRDQSLFGRVVTEPLSDLSAEQAPVSLIDKLNLIAAYHGNKTESVIMASQKQSPEKSQYSSEPFVFALEQLKKLQDHGAFPPINLEVGYQRVEYRLNTYMDMARPAVSTQVWELPLYTDSFNAYLWMDAESHQIYQYYLGSGKLVLEYEQEKVIQGLGDYLGLQLEEMTIRDKDSTAAVYQAGGISTSYLFNFGAGRSLEVNLDSEQE